MDDDELKQDIGLPLAGGDGLDDDFDDPMDRELEEELDKTHPITDSDIHPEDKIETVEPNKGNAVKGYNPDESEDSVP